jgi:hypothetical protein
VLETFLVLWLSDEAQSGVSLRSCTKTVALMKGTINRLKQKVNGIPRLDHQGSRTNINGGWIYLDQTTHKQAVQKRKSDREGRCVCLSFAPRTL